MVVNILRPKTAKLKAHVVVFQNILYMSGSGRFLEDVKEATVIYYKTWNIPIKSPHRSTGLQLLSTMKTVARAFKTGDTGTVGPKAGSVYSNSKLKPSFRRKGGASKTLVLLQKRGKIMNCHLLLLIGTSLGLAQGEIDAQPSCTSLSLGL